MKSPLSECRSLDRVQYPEDMMRQLIKLVRQGDPRLSAEDRIGLLDDCFQLSYAGYYPGSLPLELLSAMSNEEEAWVLFAMQAKFSAYLGRGFSQESISSNVKALSRHVFGHKAIILGFDARPGDLPLDPLAREVCVSGALLGDDTR